MSHFDYKKNWLTFRDFKEKFQKTEVEEFPNMVVHMIPRPKVSVKITTYQHVNFIKDAIESILVQKTDFPFEIIIGDDESTDGTREICIEYAKKFPDLIRLFLHKRENNIKVLGKPCGIFQIAYNLYQARGEYIAGCSGDDYWTDPFKLQKQYNFLSENFQYSYCYHGFKYKYEKKVGNESFYSEVKNVDRIQTLFYRNYFNVLPEEFLSVISEDTFIKYILSIEGKKKFIESIKPSICRIHDGNIWGASHEGKNYDAQAMGRIDTWEKIKKGFKSTPYEKEISKMISIIVIIDTLKHPKLNIYKKIIKVFKTPFFHIIILRLFVHKCNEFFKSYANKTD